MSGKHGNLLSCRKGFVQQGGIGDLNRAQTFNMDLVFSTAGMTVSGRLYLNLSSQRDIKSCFSYKFLMHFHY